jgi:hypothetical protein
MDIKKNIPGKKGLVVFLTTGDTFNIKITH